MALCYTQQYSCSMKITQGGRLLPYYKPYRYVPSYRVGCLDLFGLKTGIDFAHFGLESGIVFKGTTEADECIYGFNSQ